MTTASGGSSTINGVLYQMLWTLLNAVEIQISSDADPENLTATKAFLVVEPGGGGGDLILYGASGRRIQQVKARTNNGTWSLAEVVKDVLPDLYKAVDITRSDDSYEFITEGRCGDWIAIAEFLEKIRLRTSFALDAAETLPFNHSTQGEEPFFAERTYTQQTLFERIVSHLQLKDESRVEAKAKVWHLLSHFTCIWERSPALLEERIDRFLLEVIDYSENVGQKRLLLLSALATKATDAGTKIRVEDLFIECGLNGHRLSDWQGYLTRAARILNRTAQLQGYVDDLNVRPIESPLPQSPIVIFSGESGQGKSWQLLSAARYLAQANVVAFHAATGIVADDTRIAAEMFWEKIGGKDHPLSLSRISERLRNLNAVPDGQWLYFCLDNLQSVEEARALAIEDWEGLGICLIGAASPLIAQEMRKQSPHRVEIIKVGDFTEQEMRKYLVGSDWTRWNAISPDVRNTLRRPLLARLYREIISTSSWIPMNEYMLYDLWWSDLRIGREVTAACLIQLAYSRLQGHSYPWTPSQLHNVGLDQVATEELIRSGGLQRTTEGNFLVWHDRLLNWLTAEALLEKHLSGNLSQDTLCAEISALFSQPQTENNFFGYVPMDIIWMLSTRHPENAALMDAVLDSLARSPRSNWRSKEMLFENLLPTVGPSVASAVIRYLVRHGGSDFSQRSAIIDGLSNFKAEDILLETRMLLGQTDLNAIRGAIQLLSQRPHPSHLDELWRLYCSMHSDPSRFAEAGNERDQSWWLKHSCYKTLKECVVLNPEWLEMAILRADAAREPVHDLGYLLAGLPGERQRWLRCKSVLHEKIDPAKERAIASNIFTHRDETEKDWLRSRIRVAEDSLGVYALRALLRLDADAAAEAVAELDDQDLYLTRSWCLRHLLLRRPKAVYTRLWQRLSTEPANVMRSFQGQEDYLTVEMVDWLLDRTEETLRHSDDLESAHFFLDILADVNRLGLLRRFEQRQGTALENHLADLLARSPRPYVSQETATREPALAVLYKIGGRDLTRVINEWLAAPSIFGRYDAFNIAFKRPDNETKWLLDSLVSFGTEREPSGNSDHLDYFAIETLARMQEWPPVIRFITQNGMNRIPKYVTDASYGSICLLDTVLTNALEAFEASNGLHAGAILALGVGGRSDYLDRINSALELSPAGSEVAHAAALALSLLDDPEGHATDTLIRLLSDGQSRHAVVIALIQNPNSRAIAALADHLQTHFDAALASDLLRFPEIREAALAEMRTVIQKQGAEMDSIFSFLERHSDLESVRDLLNTYDLRQTVLEIAFAQEGWFWHTGSKAHAIFAVSAFDPQAAFDAVLSTLKNPKSRDREYYPYRLIAIDKARAVNALFEVACTGQSYVLAAHIGRALAEVPEESQFLINEEMHSSSERRRSLACQLAAYQPVCQELQESVRICLDDERVEVVQAAEEALWQMQKNIWCDELMDAFAVEASPERRWRLLDAALNIGDPGDLHRYWPHWLAKHCLGLPYAWHEYIGEALKKRREKVLKDAEDADKRENN